MARRTQVTLHDFIAEQVMADPEWRVAYEAADATREAGRALARARRDAGLSQTELALRSGPGQAVISRIEGGTVSPTLDTLGKIAKGLGMRPVVVFEPLDSKREQASGIKRRPGVSAKTGKRAPVKSKTPRTHGKPRANTKVEHS
ncbi:MAG: helix-turn-helix domain-containing protein [Actinomycetota bacterium]|nr:helix-turn-helix transcriptional regulator [Actinomycetota bacterium]